MFKTYEELKEKFPVGTIYCIKKQENYYYYYYKVDGYLFDGEYWYPAKRTWDGWDKIDEDEINMGGF